MKTGLQPILNLRRGPSQVFDAFIRVAHGFQPACIADIYSAPHTQNLQQPAFQQGLLPIRKSANNSRLRNLRYPVICKKN
jgi:hypothetical protein